MMNIFRSITENEAGVLKANLSEPEFDGLRNDPFHFSDTNIKVSRYLVSYYVIQLLSKSYLLPITQEAGECSIVVLVSSPRTTLHFSYFTSDSQVVRHSIRRATSPF